MKQSAKGKSVETSFAIRKVLDGIERTVNRIDSLNTEAPSVLTRLKDHPRQSVQQHQVVDVKAFADAFCALTDEEIVLETIALEVLLDKIPECKDTVVVAEHFDDYLNSLSLSEDLGCFLQLAKSLFALPYINTKDAEPHLTQYLKHLRYRPIMLKAVQQCVPKELLDAIEQNYIFNFIGYATAVYKYYYEFYRRGDQIDKVMLETLASLKDREKVSFIIDSLMSSNEATISFNFKVNFNMPTEHILEDLNGLRDNIALFVMMIGKEKQDFLNRPYHILTDYIRIASGQLANRENVVELFDRWDRVLKVYDLRHNKNYSYGRIKSILKDAVGDPRKDYLEAKNLILSATNGLFPE